MFSSRFSGKRKSFWHNSAQFWHVLTLLFSLRSAARLFKKHCPHLPHAAHATSGIFSNSNLSDVSFSCDGEDLKPCQQRAFKHSLYLTFRSRRRRWKRENRTPLSKPRVFAIKDAGFCRRFSLQPIPIVNLWDCFVRNSVNACHIVSLCSAAFFFSSETGSIHFLQSLQAMGMLGKKRNDPTRRDSFPKSYMKHGIVPIASIKQSEFKFMFENLKVRFFREQLRRNCW